MRPPNKVFVIVSCVVIVLVACVSVAPVFYRLVTDTGIKVEPLAITNAKPASTDLNGQWSIVHGNGKNSTQVGFTFREVLPGQRKTTSGSTHRVDGYVEVSGDHLTKAHVSVDARTIETDIEKRDINVRRTLLETQKYPTASFTSTAHVDLSGLKADGSPAKVTIPGTLTLHGTSKEVSPTFTVYRTGSRVLMYTELPVDRLDYNVKTPQFVAAVIAKKGTLDIRLVFEKASH